MDAADQPRRLHAGGGLHRLRAGLDGTAGGADHGRAGERMAPALHRLSQPLQGGDHGVQSRAVFGVADCGGVRLGRVAVEGAGDGAGGAHGVCGGDVGWDFGGLNAVPRDESF